jgi:hypothetical protein
MGLISNFLVWSYLFDEMTVNDQKFMCIVVKLKYFKFKLVNKCIIL